MFLDSLTKGYVAPKPSSSAIGCVVGLVAITPACGFVQPGWALLIGVVGAIGSSSFNSFARSKCLIDDDGALMFSIHGVAGIIGSLMTGVCAQVCKIIWIFVFWSSVSTFIYVTFLINLYMYDMYVYVYI